MPDDTPQARAPDAGRNAALQTVLCVDDEPNILASLRRVLRGSGWNVLTATDAAEALARLHEHPAEVVISDMRMPGMDGVEFLSQVREHWPTSIRILLTGHAEMNAAVAAINRGGIFRYINKPWNDAELLTTIAQGLELIDLQREKSRLEKLTFDQNLELRSLNEGLERRVLERTAELDNANKRLKQSFLTSIKVFSNLLELRGGRLLGHGRRVADLARSVARAMGLGDQETQDIFIAGMLHDIGHIVLPDTMLAKPVARFDAAELSHYRQHPLIGEQLLMALDEMHTVAGLIHAHHERYDGRGYPDGQAGPAIPLGARILALVDTYDELQDGHLGGAQPSADEARILLQQGRGTQFDPEVLEVFLQVTHSERRKASKALILGTAELLPDMVLAGDLISPQGVLLLAAGHHLTESLIRRIRAHEFRAGQPFRLHISRGSVVR